MSFLSDILNEALLDQTLVYAAILVITIALLRAIHSEGRRHVRGMVILFLCHVAMLPMLAILRQRDQDIYRDVRFAALILLALSAIGTGGAIVFDFLGPLIRVRAPRILRDLVAGAGGIVAISVIASHLGMPLAGLIAIPTVAGAVIGLSAQDMLSNILGGLALQLDNSISVGDWIKVGDLNGKVVDIRWRYTAIETRNWETIIVPNSVLMRGQVLILGRRTDKPVQWRRWVWFNVDFRYPPTQVTSIVEQAVRAAPIERVAADPLPNCILMDFTDSYGKYAVRYWLTDLAVDDPTDSVIRQRIYFALKRAGIALSIPAQAIFATVDDPARRAGKTQQEHDQRLRALSKVDFFHHFSDEDKAHLADGLIVAPFAKNETITKQGAEAHWLYIMTSGEASVHVAVDGGDREVARLKAGSFFGEMSLMTGAPRSATVLAVTDVECYKLDKQAFQDIIRRRPEIADEIADILSKRRVELEAVKEGLSEEQKRKRLESAKTALVDSIRVFFGLAEEPVGV